MYKFIQKQQLFLKIKHYVKKLFAINNLLAVGFDIINLNGTKILLRLYLYTILILHHLIMICFPQWNISCEDSKLLSWSSLSWVLRISNNTGSKSTVSKMMIIERDGLYMRKRCCFWINLYIKIKGWFRIFLTTN